MVPLPALSLLETRVLGVLVEKQHTVPDTYPLTLNALAAGCNQKTSRDPVIEASDAEVQAAVDSLKGLSLVMESSGGRVMRYAHNVGKVLQLPPQSVALLAVLFLRGPQTPGEIRINADRLHRFGDLLAVQAFLDELAERPQGPLVRELPRQPGAREARWAHLVSGEPAVETRTPTEPGAPPETVTAGEIVALKANLARVEAEVASLRETVARMASEMGLSPGADPPPGA